MSRHGEKKVRYDKNAASELKHTVKTLYEGHAL